MIEIESIKHAGLLLLHIVKWSLELMGVFVIVLGALESGWRYVKDWLFKQREPSGFDFDTIRRELGLSIALGLEFILAGDVILTIILPDYYNLGLLAILVVIRTVLNYFLDQELEQLRERA